MNQILHLRGLGSRDPIRPDIFSKKARVVVRLDEYEDLVDHVDVDPEAGRAAVGGTTAAVVVTSDREALGGIAERETHVLWAGEIDPAEAWIALSEALAKMPGMPPGTAAAIEHAVLEVRGETGAG